MPTINAGTSTVVSLAAGAALRINAGTGVASANVLGASPQALTGLPTTIGPFAAATTVSISAISSIDYGLSSSGTGSVYITPDQLASMTGVSGVTYILDRPPYYRYYWDGTQFRSPSVSNDWLFNWKKSNTRLLAWGMDLSMRTLPIGTPVNCSFAFIGDSQTFGSNAGAGTGQPSTSDSMRMSFVRRISDLLARDMLGSGSVTNYNSAFSQKTPTDGDNRRGTPAGVTIGDYCPGGGCIWWPASGNITATYSIAFLEAFDTLDIFYRRSAGYGDFTVNVDGGATLLTQTTAGADGLVKATITGIALGVHTVNLARVSNVTAGTDVQIVGVVPRNSTVRELVMLNYGWPGSTSGDWNNSAKAWNPIAGAGAVISNSSNLNTRAYFIKLGTNDISGGPAVYASFVSNMQAMIDYLKTNNTGANIVLVIPHPMTPSGNITYAAQAQMAADLYALAAANDLALIDEQKVWVPSPQPYGVPSSAADIEAGRGQLTNLGYQSDNIHNKAIYHAKVARHFHRAMSSIF